MQPTRRQPLLVRAGTRFVCHADGVCCSDVHTLGPIKPAELVPLRRLLPDPATLDPSVKGMAFRTQGGGCVFLRDDHLCRVHAELGVATKPATCRRYPFNLVQTPVGLRVVTPHRCPCRTLGPRPLVTPESVAEEIVIPDAPLDPDYSVSGDLRLNRNERVRFAAWLPIEALWITQLCNTRDPAFSLQSDPWPQLRGMDWQAIAAKFCKANDGSSFETAKSLMGFAIAAAREGKEIPALTRPWSRFFDAAEKRVLQAPQTANEMYGDWLADELWSLQWTQYGSFARGRVDLATRLDLAKRLAASFEQQGLRLERAVAEALLVVDVVTHCELWFDVARAMQET